MNFSSQLQESQAHTFSTRADAFLLLIANQKLLYKGKHFLLISSLSDICHATCVSSEAINKERL